jgi:hypothetical protein
VAEARAKAAAARTDKANHPSQWTWQQLQPVLSAEQKRWRSNLAAYLGRPVDVPLLAPGAPVLDMQELFIRVRRGATAASTLWSSTATCPAATPGAAATFAAAATVVLLAHNLHVLLRYLA